MQFIIFIQYDVEFVSGSLLELFPLLLFLISRVQMKSWAGKALESFNCCAFLKHRIIGAC
jgi:hypothetical protein